MEFHPFNAYFVLMCWAILPSLYLYHYAYFVLRQSLPESRLSSDDPGLIPPTPLS